MKGKEKAVGHFPSAIFPLSFPFTSPLTDKEKRGIIRSRELAGSGGGGNATFGK